MLEKFSVLRALLTVGVTAASAASVVVSTPDVNLRGGPATSYPVMTVAPQGGRIVAHGYAADHAWCDVVSGIAAARCPPAKSRSSTMAALSSCLPLSPPLSA